MSMLYQAVVLVFWILNFSMFMPKLFSKGIKYTLLIIGLYENLRLNTAVI